MPRESNLEFKVGFFVVIAFIAFCVFLFSISGSSVFQKGESFNVIFKFANGLKISAPVRVAGVDGGIVKNITLFLDRQDGITKARVEVWIKKGLHIPFDSEVIINQLGMMGEKYLEITPGIETDKFIKDGQEIFGKDPISQAAMSEKVMEVSRKIEGVATGLSNITQDKDIVGSLKLTLEHLSTLTGSLSEIIDRVKEGEGTLGKFIYDDSLYEDLQGMAADLKKNPWKLLYKPQEK